jgi:hypothetical protein
MLAPIHGASWGYRHRARFSARFVPKKGGALVGFRERRSTYVADMASCQVLPPRVSALIAPLRDLVSALSIRDRVPQIEVAVGAEVVVLVLRNLAPLAAADEAALRAFADVRREIPDALLAVSIDPKAPELHASLRKLIKDLGLERDVIVLGSIWEQLPMLYNATTVYCTPSVMEGFGMSAQEAASCAKPVVASNLVPYVCEYLVGKTTDEVVTSLDGGALGYVVGDGGIVVLSDFVGGFAAALTRLLQSDSLRTEMGRRAYEITIPYFTWTSRTKDLLDDLGITPHRADGELEVA